jgi:hypothetical protein
MTENLQDFEEDLEFQLYKEYRDVFSMFTYAIETQRRYYLANEVNMEKMADDKGLYWKVNLKDAWVWDMYRPARFLQNVDIITFNEVSIEKVSKAEV